MSAYHDQSWGTRYATLGDAAEAIFEDVAPLGAYARFGWNRPNVNMKKMSDFLRHAPDYYTQPGILVEVMGCGADGIFKVKTDKWDALKQWHKHNEVALFVWNSGEHEWALIRWAGLVALIAKARKHVTEFSDGNRYYPLPWAEVGGIPYEQ